MTSAPSEQIKCPIRLESERLVLALPGPEAAPRVVAYYSENRKHLERWSPPRAPGFYTTEFWRWRLEQSLEEFRADRALRLYVFERGQQDGPVIGQVSFTELVRGPFQSCFLGYNIDHRHQGQGKMYEALERGIAYAFSELALHRISANYRPNNLRSASLLRRLGFSVEGYARDYLFIDGAWRDHVLTSRRNPNSPMPRVVR